MSDDEKQLEENLRSMFHKSDYGDEVTPSRLAALFDAASHKSVVIRRGRPVYWLIVAATAAIIMIVMWRWQAMPPVSQPVVTAKSAEPELPAEFAVRGVIPLPKSAVAIAEDRETPQYFAIHEGQHSGNRIVVCIRATGIELKQGDATQLINVEPVALTAREVAAHLHAGNPGAMTASDVCWLGLAARQDMIEAVHALQTLALDANFEWRSLADELVAGGQMTVVGQLQSILRNQQHTYRQATLTQLATINTPAARDALREVAQQEADPLHEQAATLLARDEPVAAPQER